MEGKMINNNMINAHLKDLVDSGTFAGNNTDTPEKESRYKGSLDYNAASLAIGQGSSAIANVFNYIGNYKAAKSNYKTTINNANELIDQTNRQIALLQKQWAAQDAENQLFIANSGLDSSSFSDVERYSLQQVEEESQYMSAYARRKATEMIRQARQAMKEAKRKKNGGLIGTILGTGAGVAIGAATGGPAGAIIGGTTGANLGGQLGAGLNSL